MGVGGWEILVILAVVLVVFGPKRIPEVSRGIGKGMREIRRVGAEFQRELNLSDVEERERREVEKVRGADESSRAPREPS
jgi:sec-independent protein translocase protein TatA